MVVQLLQQYIIIQNEDILRCCIRRRRAKANIKHIFYIRVCFVQMEREVGHVVIHIGVECGGEIRSTGVIVCISPEERNIGCQVRAFGGTPLSMMSISIAMCSVLNKGAEFLIRQTSPGGLLKARGEGKDTEEEYHKAHCWDHLSRSLLKVNLEKLVL